MRLEIYEEIKDKEEVQAPVRLKMEKKDGDIYIYAVDESGERLRQGSLITFCSDGRIHRCMDVDNNLGFQLDAHDRIKTDD